MTEGLHEEPRAPCGCDDPEIRRVGYVGSAADGTNFSRLRCDACGMSWEQET